MDIRRFLFLSLGLTRAHPRKDRKRARETQEKMVEPQGSRNCRRNIIVLSGVLVLAGLAGADFDSLNLFGVTPSGKWGVTVLGIAAVSVQVYWYFLRYQHLLEDGRIEHVPGVSTRVGEPLRVSWNNALNLVRKEADLFANRVAFVMTLLSWWFITSWIIEGPIRQF